jgi:hypothetical protein
MKKIIFTLSSMFALASYADAQVDTTGIYGERADSLDATIFVERQAGKLSFKGKGYPYRSDFCCGIVQDGML